MPEICRFFGIIIKMFFNDTSKHNKPHFHVECENHKAVIGIDGDLIAGSLPAKQLKLIQAWAILHEEELYKAWNKAVKKEHFEKIKPLS